MLYPCNEALIIRNCALSCELEGYNAINFDDITQSLGDLTQF